jgi:hypothetical protein
MLRQIPSSQEGSDLRTNGSAVSRTAPERLAHWKDRPDSKESVFERSSRDRCAPRNASPDSSLPAESIPHRFSRPLRLIHHINAHASSPTGRASSSARPLSHVAVQVPHREANEAVNPDLRQLSDPNEPVDLPGRGSQADGGRSNTGSHLRAKPMVAAILSPS